MFSKLQKRYWELEHVSGHPLILAVQDFHAPRAMTWSNTGLIEYLYGIRQIERKLGDGRSEIVSEPIEAYLWEGKRIPAGFFRQPDAENISAVIANPGGTIAKFNRMGFVAGFGDRSIRMVRGGICYRGKLVPESYADEVHAQGYGETWCEAISVYHNPGARHPLATHAIPGAAHHTSNGQRILSSMPPFFPVGTNTVILVPS